MVNQAVFNRIKVIGVPLHKILRFMATFDNLIFPNRSLLSIYYFLPLPPLKANCSRTYFGTHFTIPATLLHFALYLW
jgi:hypothetical protein